MQARVEHNKIKQQVAYHRADYQAWHHLDGQVEIIEEAERLGLRCLVISISFDINIEDQNFLKWCTRRLIQTAIVPGLPLERLAHVATVHDEVVRDTGLFGFTDPQGSIVGKRTSIHVKLLDYDLATGNTLGLSVYGASYYRILIFQQYVNLKYGFLDPSEKPAGLMHIRDFTPIMQTEETEDGTKIESRQEFKKRIEENVFIEATLSGIESRNDLILYLMGYGTITTCSENHVTIYSPDQDTRFKFKGGIFALNAYPPASTASPKKGDIGETELQSLLSATMRAMIEGQLEADKLLYRNDIIETLMTFSTIIYASKYQIIIQPDHEKSQYNLRGGIFSEEGLKLAVQTLGRQNTPKTQEAIKKATENILRDHKIKKRSQLHDGFAPSSESDLREKLETLYTSGYANLKKRLRKAEKRMYDDFQALLHNRRLTGVASFDISTLFDPAPFPEFPRPPRGHSGPSDIPPVPRKELQQDQGVAGLQFETRGGPSTGGRHDSGGPRENSKAEQGPGSGSRHDPQRSAKNSKAEQGAPQSSSDDPRSESEDSRIKNHWDSKVTPVEVVKAPDAQSQLNRNQRQSNSKKEHNNHDHHIHDIQNNLAGLCQLASLFSKIAGKLQHLRDFIEEIRKRRQRELDRAQKIERESGKLRRSIEEFHRSILANVGTPRPSHTKTRERDRGPKI